MDADLTAPDALPGGTMSATIVLALGLLYFASVFAAGFVLGTARTLLLEPALGPLPAVVLELPLMLAFAWWICRRLLRRQPRPSAGAAVVMGAVAFACLMVAEAALSLGLAGRSLAGHLAMYREPAHALGLAGQLLFAAWPVVQVRQRKGRVAANAGAGRRA